MGGPCPSASVEDGRAGRWRVQRRDFLTYWVKSGMSLDFSITEAISILNSQRTLSRVSALGTLDHKFFVIDPELPSCPRDHQETLSQPISLAWQSLT